MRKICRYKTHKTLDIKLKLSYAINRVSHEGEWPVEPDCPLPPRGTAREIN